MRRYHYWKLSLIMTPIRKLTSFDFGVLFIGLWLLSKAVGILLRRSNATRLKGPPSESWLFGFSSFMTIGDPSLAYEQWAEQYGAVFRVPITIYVSITSRLGMGQTKIVVCDPKAIQHIYSKTTFGYIYSKSRKKELTAIVNDFSQTCRIKMADVHNRSERVSCGRKANTTRGKCLSIDSLHHLC
jgi:hypothetical protein